MKKLGVFLLFFGLPCFASDKDCKTMFEFPAPMNGNSNPSDPLSQADSDVTIGLHEKGTSIENISIEEFLAAYRKKEDGSNLSFLVENLDPRSPLPEDLRIAALRYLQVTKTKHSSKFSLSDKKEFFDQLVNAFLSTNPLQLKPDDLKTFMEKQRPYLLTDIFLKNHPTDPMSFLDLKDSRRGLPSNLSLWIQDLKLEDALESIKFSDDSSPFLTNVLSPTNDPNMSFSSQVPFYFTSSIQEIIQEYSLSKKQITFFETRIHDLIKKKLISADHNLNFFAYNPATNLLYFIYSNSSKFENNIGDPDDNQSLIIHYAEINLKDFSYFHTSHSMSARGITNLRIWPSKNTFTSVIELAMHWKMQEHIFGASNPTYEHNIYLLPRKIREVLTVK